MSRRWVSLICLAAGSVMLVGAAAWIVEERRFQAGFERAKGDVDARRFDRARRWLLAQSAARPERAEIDFLLGLCEREAGSPQAAVWAWARVPLASAPGLSAVALSAQTLVTDLGRFADAEALLLDNLAEAGAGAAQLRYLLTQLFYWEGRLDEMRLLLQQGWSTSRDRTGDLRDLWMIDSAVVMIERVQTAVEQAARLAPQDDRVWLAQANLALLRGQMSDASRWLDACLDRRPDDPIVWRARLRWARAAGSVDEARRAVAHLPAELFSESDALRLGAWLASRTGETSSERAALEKLIERVPGDTQALERLAALASGAGDTARAAELNRRKARIDRAKERYLRLLAPDRQITEFSELGRLAEVLGRGFEARGWWVLAWQQQPSAEATAAVERLGPPAPNAHLPAGEALAFHVPAFRSGRPPEARPARSSDASELLAQSPADAPALFVPTYRDDAESAGLRFVFENGRSPRRQLPETTAGGVALLDYDGDGRMDVYVVQGGVFPPSPSRPSGGDRLFHNRGDGTFEDVSERSGIGRLSRGYGHGVAVGDYDNDGRPDLFLTRWRSYMLLHNRGDGSFADMTEPSGLAGDRDWPTSAAWADLDNDGDLDLYVCHYLVWDADHPKLCERKRMPGESDDPLGRYDYCMPNPFPSRPDHLFRNDGGRFVDVTAQAGIVDLNGRGLGVVAADLDDDGLVDLFVANDTTANYLFRNLGGLRFEEVATSAGVACNADGAFQAGMGTAVGDQDGDLLPDLAVTNFYGESTSFFKNLDKGLFADRTAAIGLAAPSRYLLGFGIVFFDSNNDGRIDLAQTNGHVIDNRPDLPLEMPGLHLIGDEQGRLIDVTRRAGPVWSVPRLGRALAAGDLDNDGRIDLVCVAQQSCLVYFHNQTQNAGRHFVTFVLEGTRSNRDGVGAVVTIQAGRQVRRAWRYGGGSYQSSSDPRIHFGLGADRIDEVQVRWPSGQVDRFDQLETDRCYRLREGQKAATLMWAAGSRP
jgi:enediyne biosynthesis protein E4